MAGGDRRNFGLDALRALAILVVLGNHAFLGFFLNQGLAAWGGWAAAVSMSSVLSIEWLFGLSGFLIGAMMIRSFEREATFWRRARSFWLRRWFRTMPNYYLFLVVNLLLVAVAIGPGQPSVLHAFFAQNLAWPESMPFFFAEAWSLAIDEWFYLAMPLLAGLFGLRSGLRPRTAFLLATVALIALPTLGRLLAEPPHPTPDMDALQDWDSRFRRVTVFHLDATGWGVLGAVTSRWFPAFWRRGKGAKAAAGAALMALGVLSVEQLYFGGWMWEAFPRAANALGLAAMGCGTFLALPWIASLRPRGRGLGWAVDRISQYSYSLYLAHLPLQFLLLASLPPAERTSLPHAGLLLVAWLGLTFAASALVHHSFEKPVSDLRERYTTRVDASPFQPAAQPEAAGPGAAQR